MEVTPQQIKNTAIVVGIVMDAIRDLKSVPSGHLYAVLMGHMTLATYEKIIGILKEAGLVEERGHLLTWKGPQS